MVDMSTGPVPGALAFVPAPPDLAPAMLGFVVQRALPGQLVAVPAHALAICTVALSTGADPGGSAFVTGSATQGRQVAVPAGLSVSVLWRASVLPRLSGEPASTFTDGVFDARDLLGDWPLAHWQAFAAPGPVAQDALARQVFAWVRRLLASAPAPRAGAVRFAQALAAWRPQAGETLPPGWGERQWQRACRDELGVHPGLLRRLARLHASVRAQADHPARWAEHAADAGFSDQAHLAREYRELAGLTPSRGQGVDALRLSAQALAPRFFGA